jgi:hypothetical protein
MEHAKNVLAEKTEHDKVSEAIKENNSKDYHKYVDNQINRGNAAIASLQQNAEIKKQATGVDYNNNGFKTTEPSSPRSFTDTVNTLRPGGSSLGGTPGPKDTHHTKSDFSFDKARGE